MTDTIKKENKWELFKKGANSPSTMSMAKFQLTLWIGIGAGIASFGFWRNGSIGLGIMFTAIGLLQLLGSLGEWRTFKLLKATEKDVNENHEEFKKLFEKMEEAK